MAGIVRAQATSTIADRRMLRRGEEHFIGLLPSWTNLGWHRQEVWGRWRLICKWGVHHALIDLPPGSVTVFNIPPGLPLRRG